eukprot:6202734-Pleurochrysis_carterae.AAC.1
MSGASRKSTNVIRSQHQNGLGATSSTFAEPILHGHGILIRGRLWGGSSPTWKSVRRSEGN